MPAVRWPCNLTSAFAAPHAQRSELEASVNNALLGTGTFGVSIRQFILFQKLIYGVHQRLVPKRLCHDTGGHQASVDVVLGILLERDNARRSAHSLNVEMRR